MTRSNKEGVQKKTKAKKDPNAPKKPSSAFMIFSSENRAIKKEENPNATFGQLGKILGAAWNELSDEDKKVTDLTQVYQDKYADLKEKYEQELAAYNETKAEVADE
jgi:hypothetical protein